MLYGELAMLTAYGGVVFFLALRKMRQKVA
jgi:hypothetical protein